MRKWFCLASLALLLCCCACGQEKQPSLGLPSMEELEEIEALYGLTRDEFLERLDIREEELNLNEIGQHADAVGFLSDRTIAGEPVNVAASFSWLDVGLPKGLFQLTLSFDLDAAREDLREVVHALLDEAVSIYGEANVTGSVDLDICLSLIEQKGEGIDMSNGAGWRVGKRTALSMAVFSFKGDGEMHVNLNFRMLPVVP